MGWLTMSRCHMSGHATAKAYLDAQFTYSRDVDSAVKGLELLAFCYPKNRTYYAAAQAIVDEAPSEHPWSDPGGLSRALWAKT